VTTILAMVAGIFFLVSPAGTSFWVKGMGFHCSPDYGSLGKTLEEKSKIYDPVKKLGPGLGPSFSAGYDFSDTWGIRLDAFSFTGTADYHRPITKVLIKTSTSPILLSAVYRFPSQSGLHSYLGAGMGVFRSELTAHAVVSGHTYEDYQTDSPLGFQVLGGTEFRLENGLFFSGEVRYLSAKTKYPGFRCIPDCSTDWSGVFVSIGVGYRFGL